MAANTVTIETHTTETVELIPANEGTFAWSIKALLRRVRKYATETDEGKIVFALFFLLIIITLIVWLKEREKRNERVRRSINMVSKISYDEYNQEKERTTREEIEKLENSAKYTEYLEQSVLDKYRVDKKNL